VNRNNEWFARRAAGNQRGQVLVLMAVSLVVLIGFAGVVIDVGRLYYGHAELQASTNAAALAGAQSLPDTTAASAATAFSGVSGSWNSQPNLPNVAIVSVSTPCLATLTGEGVSCVPPANANAIVVKQQVTVAPTFMRLFGVSSVTLAATATAAMRGSARTPYNVAIVMDTTGSMDGARLRNAMNGAQVLLQSLSPCLASALSCGPVTPNTSGGGGNVANPGDRVALYAYPPVTAASAANDYNCPPLNQPTTAAYATPFPSTSTYRIVNFSSDYRTSDAAASLNSDSDLVGAVGATTSTGCLQAKGGYGTYFAQAIHLAQADLRSTALPNVQNVIIVLSDGDANATNTKTKSEMPGASTTSGTYVSTLNECQQAIAEAQAATAAGTRVYTVAYGASNSGCSTDVSPPISPCATLQQMASNASTFFKDNSSSCSSGARPTTDLNTIFTEIAGDLTVSRLIPNGTP